MFYIVIFAVPGTIQIKEKEIIMHKEKVLSQLREMRLSAMADSFEQRLQSGDHRDLSAEEFFSLCVEDEFIARQNRRFKKMVNAANFKPEQACIQNLNYNPSRGLEKKEVMRLTNSLWVENAENIIITGPTGTGKTYLAEAIGLQACKMDYKTKKIRYRTLFEEIKAAKGTGMYLKYLKKLSRIKVLIIDDFLMQAVEKSDGAYLIEVIEEKQQLGSVIVTTQYPVDQWHNQFPDQTVADAICDRLVHQAIIFNLKGESMRKKIRSK